MKFGFPHRLSLRNKVAAAALAFFLAGIWPLSYLTTRLLEQNLTALLSDQQFATVRHVADDLDQKLKLRVEALQSVAREIPVAELDRPAEMQLFLSQRILMQKFFTTGVVLIGRNGHGIADFPQLAGRASGDYQTLEYFQQVLATGQPAIGKPRIGRFSQKPVVAVAVPLKNAAGSVEAVLAGFIGLTEPAVFDASNAGIGKDSDLLVISPRDALIVTATNADRILQPAPGPGINPQYARYVAGLEGSGIAVSSLGVENLSSARRMTSTDWLVIGMTPTSTAFAPVRAIQQQIFRASIILSLLLAAALWWMMQRQLRPMVEATHRLHEMAVGHQPMQPLPVEKRDEIGQMLEAFNILQAKVLRLTQVYAALSQCNQAIVHCQNEDELFAQVCKIAVQFGGMKMAWVSRGDAATRRVRPIASFGDGIGYLDNIEISFDAASPFGGGPTGTAIREQRPFWCQDFQNDPATGPWHKRGARFGWRASAALPLYRNGVVFGALSLYSGETNPFDETARDLLVEMTSDISFALENFERERQRKQSEAQLHLASKVFEQSNEGIAITDANRRMILVNRAFTEISGYSQAEALGQSPKMLSSGHHSQEFYRSMWEAIDTKGFWQGEVWNRRKDGNLYPEWLTISRVLDANGKVTNYIGSFSDSTQDKDTEEHIKQLAHFDPLTGLPNRSLLGDRTSYAVSMAQRSHSQVAIMLLDLDHFKNINDTLGHHIGDEILIEVAKRLKSAMRDEDTVSRLGGDEFILVLPDTDVDGAARVADKLLRTIAQNYINESHELVVTPSIGIAMYPSDGENFEALYKCADVAMYRAKHDGRNTFRFFAPGMQTRSARTLQLVNALRNAIEREQLSLHYQPQISLADGRVIGAEALLRWQHPELGAVQPAEFIPIAEDSGLILPIGEWVLRSAVEQMHKWIDAGMTPMAIAVNLSAVQFRHAYLPNLIAQILYESGLEARHLEIELTEGVAMDDPLGAIAMMDKLHQRGIRMSIDDFGTGYSSLSYLKRFQIHKLKIDQSFVRNLTQDPEDKAIVIAIISLARSLGMKTIAEGVETAEQLAFLREQGCEEAQGYYFSKPLPAGEFAALMREKQTL
jgi:diguanylate cyclase (GGDEF)-like protein/PAS domain S-box-containing protein